MGKFLSKTFWGPPTTASQSHGGPEESDRVIDKKLYQFCAPENGTLPKVQVVFVHGIEAGCSDMAFWNTWKNDDGTQIWPRWLKEGLDNLRILSVGYDSSAKRGMRQGRLDLYNTAENIVQDLTNAGGVTEECPIFMVGKDIGCIVIEAVCVMAKEKEKAKLLSNLKGLFFYCSPQLGATSFSRGYFNRFDGELVKNLCWGNKEVSRLTKDYLSLKEELRLKTKVLCAKYQGVPANLLDKVIEDASSRFGADEVSTAFEDSSSITRPRDTTSESFTNLKNFISNMLPSSDCLNKVAMPAESSQTSGAQGYTEIEASIRDGAL